MKRIAMLLIFTLMLLLMVCSTSFADTVCQIDRYQVTLPGAWKMSNAEQYSIDAKYVLDGVQLAKFKIALISTNGWPQDQEELAAALADAGGFDSVGEWKEIQIAGESTVCFPVLKDGYTVGYFSAVRSGETSAYGLFFDISETYGDLDIFYSIVKTVEKRSWEENGKYRFGDALVKFNWRNWLSVNSGKSIYLTFDWANVGDEPTSFDRNVEVIVYQDGIELSGSTRNDVDATIRIMPGKELSTGKYFILRSKTGQIDVYVSSRSDSDVQSPTRHYTFTITK